MFNKPYKPGLSDLWDDRVAILEFECVSYGPNGQAPIPTGKPRPFVDDELAEMLYNPNLPFDNDTMADQAWLKGSKSHTDNFVSVYFKKFESEEVTLLMWGVCRPYVQKWIEQYYSWQASDTHVSKTTVQLFVVRRDHLVDAGGASSTEFFVLGHACKLADLMMQIKYDR